MKILRNLPSQSLIVNTGEFTGRSPKDRYFVQTNKNKKIIDWSKRNKLVSEKTFNILHLQLQAYLIENINFEFKGNVISDSQNSYGINLLTEEKWYTQFAKNIFRNDNFSSFRGEIQILHAPSFLLSEKFEDIDNSNFVLIHPEKKIILIGGTGYAGEIKKSVFSLLNIDLINHDILPMHCSANFDSNKRTTLYFGLSGTGKTTLSSDSTKKLIGDDEHGWSPSGIFNVEGGCYAKVVGLDEKKEPVIYKATHAPSSIIENVVLDSKGNIDFNDTSITENTRSCYSLDEVDNVYAKECAPHATNIIMLTCDAFGVLPPVSKLSVEQAVFHFVSGYTAKIPGTETNIKVPRATFSPCFGGPFMPRFILDYANFFEKRIVEHQSQCWLINTGWWGGPYGEGQRIDISITREILDKCINDFFTSDTFVQNEYFNLSFPSFLDDEKTISLNPANKWKNKEKYKKTALYLSDLFRENFYKLNMENNSLINKGCIFY
jgi:phosphoenolpyruvate carboxykinase (ATP)